ncbi:transposase [Effusibacillus lacus]|uniref:Transposase n=1 Tax=Effusibacillus lacus TaxID=1348429 RepID=A0A292YDH4_9BACL|nr:transposase [Effusibacillus lacus]GAX90162.1 transposase [Effusibacillus lacus]
MKKLKQYDSDFKRQTVEYILEQRKPVAQVARELDISPNTLHGWLKQYKRQTNQDAQGGGAQLLDDRDLRELHVIDNIKVDHVEAH